MNKNGYLSLAISVISIALSIYATFICDKRIEADWMSILIGILALLVTTLIGWQIFSIVKIDKIKNDIKERYNDIYILTENEKIELYATMSEMYISQMEKKFNDITSFRYAMNHLYLIITLDNLNEYKRCEKSISSLIKRINKIKPIKLSKERRLLLFKLISRASQCKTNNAKEIMELTKAFID